jgi:hypothetical protein
MRCLLKKAANQMQNIHSHIDSISTHIATSMLGRMVSVQHGSQPPAHGMVSGVLVDNGSPRIVVNGNSYELRQVLTVTPLAFN